MLNQLILLQQTIHDEIERHNVEAVKLRRQIGDPGNLHLTIVAAAEGAKSHDTAQFALTRVLDLMYNQGKLENHKRPLRGI